MRKKINLVDSTFSHLTGGLLPEPNKGYSVHAKVSNYIEWVTDGSGEGIFYTDARIPEAFGDNSDAIDNTNDKLDDNSSFVDKATNALKNYTGVDLPGYLKEANEKMTAINTAYQKLLYKTKFWKSHFTGN